MSESTRDCGAEHSDAASACDCGHALSTHDLGEDCLSVGCECHHFRHTASASLRLVPVSLAQANEHVAAWHRHNEPVVQCIYRVGVSDDDGVLHAVAIVENPKARGNADGDTVEITRLASDGTRNACSMLYGACARAAFALGYRRVITYIQANEPGTSTLAAGFRLVAERPARKGWSAPSRPCDNHKYRSVQRQMWEVTV